MSEVVPLITCDGDGRYVCNEETMAMLESMKGPVGAVAIAGKYRTGKSLLLNCLCDTSLGDGFGVGNTVQACTKGLWMCRTPLSGAHCSILCIDTEGIDALDADATHDVKIFTLALLLSSVFLYNSIGALDEAGMQALGLVTRVVNNVRVDSAREACAEELVPHMPAFTWLLRDFSLKLVDRAGVEQTPDEYFESALLACNAEKEPVRKAIRETFQKRSLFTLPRPATDERILQSLEYKRDRLQPRFKQAVDALRTRLVADTLPMRTDNHVFSGGMFASMCRSFAARINAGDVPVIRDAWSLMESIRHRDAKDRLLQTAEDALRRDPSSAATAALLASFDEECSAAAPEMRSALEETLNALAARIVAERDRASELAMRALLQRAVADPAQLPQCLSELDLDDPCVQRRLAQQWLPDLTAAAADRICALETEGARHMRDFADAEDRHRQETHRLEEQLKALRHISDSPTPPETDAVDTNVVELDESRADAESLEAAHGEMQGCLDAALADLASVRTELEQTRAQLRAAQDRVADVEAANHTLEAAGRESDLFREELQRSSQTALEQARRAFDESLREAEARCGVLETEARRAAEDLRGAETRIETGKVEYRRALEHSLAMQGSLQDGQERLLIANRDLLEDARIRDQRHRAAYETLAREHVLSESSRAENAVLKRSLDAAEDDAREFKKAKSDFERMKSELLLSREECVHLRASKSDIIREREEIRSLLTLTDRKLAVEQAGRAR